MDSANVFFTGILGFGEGLGVQSQGQTIGVAGQTIGVVGNHHQMDMVGHQAITQQREAV